MDEKGEPLPGASVLIAGKNLGTVTDRNGNFRLVLPGKKRMWHLLLSEWKRRGWT